MGELERNADLLPIRTPTADMGGNAGLLPVSTSSSAKGDENGQEGDGKGRGDSAGRRYPRTAFLLHKICPLSPLDSLVTTCDHGGVEGTSLRRERRPAMQVFKSGYGRKGIRVDDVVPTHALTGWLGRTHVGTPAEEVETVVRAQVEANRRKSDDQGWTDQLAEETVRFALWQHAENLAEYCWVMGGGH
jgi:hypothetical protein